MKMFEKIIRKQAESAEVLTRDPLYNLFKFKTERITNTYFRYNGRISFQCSFIIFKGVCHFLKLAFFNKKFYVICQSKQTKLL